MWIGTFPAIARWMLAIGTFPKKNICVLCSMSRTMDSLRVRPRRLLDSPATPKMLFNVKSSVEEGRERELTANVNPFTPTGMLQTGKRTRSKRNSNGSSLNSFGEGDTSDDSDEEVALHQTDVARYHKDFHQVSLLGKGNLLVATARASRANDPSGSDPATFSLRPYSASGPGDQRSQNQRPTQSPTER